MKKLFPYILAIVSGFLFISPGITPLPGLVLLIGFLPVLYAEELLTRPGVYRSGLKVFIAAFLCFLTANILCLGWLQKLLSYWAILFLFYNTLLSTMVFWLFSATKKKLGSRWGYLSLLVYTVAFEYIYLNINLSFPGLLVGVEFAGMGNVLFIQWYEYTGVLGGSAWVLLCNILLFSLLKSYIMKDDRRKRTRLWLASALTILLPLCFSLFLYYSYREKENPVEIVIVQPNIDPYKDKFNMNYDVQLDSMLSLAQKYMTPQTEYVIFPETALEGNMWLNNIRENMMVMKIRDSFLVHYPQAKLITGVNMMEYYVTNGKTPTPSAKKATNNDRIFYDYYNAALLIDAKGNVEAYKKSKLVLGTEFVPFTNVFPAFEKLSIQLGGGAQSRGTQPYPTLLHTETRSMATVICYESLFGEYVSRFVRLGAEAIFVITNDGWWDKTPGPRLHLRFSQLRAIENRRAVVRCGNTGISAFIDQKGEITEKSEWWTATGMNNSININDELTFYTRYGDFIGKICLWLSGAILVIILFKGISFFRRKDKK